MDGMSQLNHMDGPACPGCCACCKLVAQTNVLRKQLPEARGMPDGTLCYCTRERNFRWLQGIEAGPDHVLGTADDVDVG
jgi:hypothetical protein